MCSGPNENEYPVGTVRAAGSPPIRGLDSRSEPRTTRTAPAEMSWSCQPVSLTGVQHSNHEVAVHPRAVLDLQVARDALRGQARPDTSTWSSRYSDTKWRCSSENEMLPFHRSGSSASSL